VKSLLSVLFFFILFFQTFFWEPAGCEVPTVHAAADQRGPAVRPQAPTGEVVKGEQWLLTIGINTYLSWPRLKTATNDAMALKNVLLERYHVDPSHVIELYDENATRKNILGTLRDLSGKINPDDSLLIFYAGHGHIDNITKKGSWIPVESGTDDTSAWISNQDIKDYLHIDAIKAKHVLLVSDSCFSGDFFRGTRGGLPEVTDTVIKKAYQLSSRQAITSGGLEPVSDDGFGGNSVFSHFLVAALQNNTKPYLIPSELFPAIKSGVAQNAEQLPQLGSLYGVGGQDGGELVLFLKNENRLENLSGKELAQFLIYDIQRKMDAAMLPPVVVIHSPRDGDEIGSAALSVTYSVRSASGEPVTAVRALVNGRPVEGSKGGRPVRPESDTLTIIVPQQDCEVSVIAENRFAPSEPATVRLKWKGKQSDEFVVKPKLYVLAVGVSNYRENSLTLRFAAKDARDFAQAMQKQKGGLYRDVAIKVLVDQDATKNNILDGLDWIQKETTSKDVAAVFISGHGINDNIGTYYYLPVDYETDKEKRTGLVFTDIKNTVSGIAGKVVVFIDTSHSGNVMELSSAENGAVVFASSTGKQDSQEKPEWNNGAFTKAGNVMELSSAENGIVVFTSSTGKQDSQEKPEWNNGAFTKALVEGIEGKAAHYSGKGRITINMLDLYISERVKELTRGNQTPATAKPSTMPDFPIAVKR
jgi:uncharacterized caspase-like protein